MNISLTLIRNDLDRAYTEAHLWARRIDDITPQQRAEVLLAASLIAAANAAVQRATEADLPEVIAQPAPMAPIAAAIREAIADTATIAPETPDPILESIVALVRDEAAAQDDETPGPTHVEPDLEAHVPIAGERRLRQLRQAAGSCGWTAPDVIRNLPSDVLADSPRPGSFLDIASDERLYQRVINWLAEEAVA